MLNESNKKKEKEQKEGYMYGHFSPGGNFLLEKKDHLKATWI